MNDRQSMLTFSPHTNPQLLISRLMDWWRTGLRDFQSLTCDPAMSRASQCENIIAVAGAYRVSACAFEQVVRAADRW